MIDEEKLKEILSQYKKDLPDEWWRRENYKWVAVKHFQDNWDVDAPNFADMLDESLKLAGNLLTSKRYLAKGMIVDIAKAYPQEAKGMFTSLFDESADIADRMIEFKKRADLLAKSLVGASKNSYQDLRAISVYLWLRYPDRHYIYKYSELRKISEVLKYDFSFTKSTMADKIRHHVDLYDRINRVVRQDASLAQIEKDLTQHGDFYWSPESCIMTGDVGFYISRKAINADDNRQWLPLNYDPGITTDTWSRLLKNDQVFDENSLLVMSRMLDNGGQASCLELSQKYGESTNFYNTVSWQLGKRVHDVTDCPLAPRDDGRDQFWPVIYLGRYSGKDETGGFVWRLRDELREALGKIELPVPNSNTEPSSGSSMQTYTKQIFLNDVFIDGAEYDRLVALLKQKKNLILQGAPGVGKTFTAKRLAWSIIGSKSKKQIEMVQFHQSYSYEDFVMGYRPNAAGGFELRKGAFYEFCERAVVNPNNKYFFIIDEINRGNLSKIFGELLMLIESDYRGPNNAISLAYAKGEDTDVDDNDAFKNGCNFYIPNNVYIIGMMNTADRSLAMMDYALRRRFAFYTIEPKFDSVGFKKHQAKLNNDHFSKLISSIENLNNNISNDPTLGNGFQIGHSYFCNLFDTGCTDAKLGNIIDFEIAPMLQEYWFDNEDKASEEIGKLKQIFQHAE